MFPSQTPIYTHNLSCVEKDRYTQKRKNNICIHALLFLFSIFFDT